MQYDKELADQQYRTTTPLFDVEYAKSLIGKTYVDHHSTYRIVDLCHTFFYIQRVESTVVTADWVDMTRVFNVFKCFDEMAENQKLFVGKSLMTEYFKGIEALRWVDDECELVCESARPSYYPRDKFGITGSTYAIIGGVNLVELYKSHKITGHANHLLSWRFNFHGFTYHEGAAMVTTIEVYAENDVSYLHESKIYRDDKQQIVIAEVDRTKYQPVTVKSVAARIDEQRALFLTNILEKFNYGKTNLFYHAKSDRWYNFDYTYAIKIYPNSGTYKDKLNIVVSEVRSNGTFREGRDCSPKKRPAGNYTPEHIDKLHYTLNAEVRKQIIQLTDPKKFVDVHVKQNYKYAQ